MTTKNKIEIKGMSVNGIRLVLDDIKLTCPQCGKSKPLAKFGLRAMDEKTVRVQPWCTTCRAGK